MTSLSNVIKRQRATSNIPLRIESKPLVEPEQESRHTIDHEQIIQERYAQLERDEEAFRRYQEAETNELTVIQQNTREAARLEGYQDGFAQGMMEGKAEYEGVTTRVNALSEELELLFDQKWRDAEEKLIELAVTVSAQVTTELVRANEELFADMIRTQMAHHIDVDALTVYVHPTRLASVQRFESMWITEDMPPLKYRGDASLAETAVRIESPNKGTEIDLSYSFERIQAKIEEALADGAY